MYPLHWPLALFLATLGVPLLIKVTVFFDNEAEVYVATSPSVPGLIVEAATLDEIRSEVESAIPMLLRLNSQNNPLPRQQQMNLQFNTMLHAE